MGDEQANKAELIDGIMSQARTEADKIRSDAKRSIEERTRVLRKRVEQIEAEATERIAAESKRLAARADAAIALAEGRTQREIENRLYRLIEERTRAAVKELRADSSYPDTLVEWLVEAALGLGATRARAAAPAEDHKFLPGCVERAVTVLRDRHDLEVAIEIDDIPLPAGQGVMLTDTEGRTAFSNLVDDRMRRFRTDLHRIVYRRVVEEPHERTDHR